MSKKLVMLILIDVVAISFMLYTVIKTIIDLDTAVIFLMGGVFAWFCQTQWKIGKKLYLIWKAK